MKKEENKELRVEIIEKMIEFKELKEILRQRKKEEKSWIKRKELRNQNLLRYNKPEFDSGSDECLEFVLYMQACSINKNSYRLRKGE